MKEKRNYEKLRNHHHIVVVEETRGLKVDLDYIYEEIEKRNTSLSKIDKNVLFNIIAFHVLDLEEERRKKSGVK